jgi:hypothetical protein
MHASRLPDPWEIQKQSLAHRSHHRSGIYNRGTHEQHVERILNVGNRAFRMRFSNDTPA